MATIAVPFQIQRLTLQAGVLTPVTAPRSTPSVNVGNATAGNIEIHTSETGTDFVILASNFERLITLSQPAYGIFRKDVIVFWLKAVNTGTVVLIWV